MSDQNKLQHFIGGEWVAPASGEYFESTNPATREPLYHAARGNAADVDRRGRVGTVGVRPIRGGAI